MTERLVLTEKTAKIAESLEKQDSGAVLDQLKGVFSKILQGFEVKWLGKQIDNLKIKEEAGSLTSDDKDLLGKLTKIFAAKKTEIDIEVGQVFEKISSGRPADAKRNARIMINKFGKDDLEYVSEPDKLRQIEKIAESLVDAGSSIAGAGEVSSRESAHIAGAMVSAEKARKEIVGSRTEQPIMAEIDKVVVRVERAGTKKNYRQSLSEAKSSGPVPKVDLKNSVNPGPERQDLYWKVLGNNEDKASRNMVKLLIEDGDAEIMGIVNKKDLTPQQADFLLDTAGNIENVEKKLKDARFKKMTKQLDPGLRAKRASKVHVAGVEVLHFSGPRRKRLERIVPLLDESKTDSENLKIILEAVSPGANLLSTTSSEYLEASNIWGEYKNWQTKYKKFEDGAAQLREKVEYRYDQEKSPARQSDRYGGSEKITAMWTTMKEYIVGHNDDGTPIYSPEGIKALEVLKSIPTTVDENGRLVPETFEQYVGRMKAEGRGPSMPGQELQELEIQRSQMNPEEFRQMVKERIKDRIKEIFSTGDSSRAPNNQSISWRLNDDLAMLDKAEDGDYRDLWMARLSSYDANIFMGSVESYDEFAKVASFLPREYLSILWEDKIDLGNFTDSLGNVVKFKLDSRGLRTSLSDAAPGKSRDEIWLAQILDTDDMWGKYQGLRQFMAFKLGEQIGVRVEYLPDGTFRINPADVDKARFKTAEGQDITLMDLVGLKSDGKAMDSDTVEYRKIEDYDLYKEWGFFLNQPLIDMDLNLDSVELERGGGAKGKWRNLSNGLRKVHGAAMNDYLKWKHMGMPVGRDDGDSYWRSFLAWKLLDKNEQGTMTFLEPLRKKLIEQGVSKDGQKEFFELFERVVYMPERWDIQSVSGTKSGGLKSVAEIRNMTTDEYSNIKKHFQKFNASTNNSFDWGKVLEIMGADVSGNFVGEAGFQMFLKKFDLNRMITRRGLSHNLWFDFVKYTGTSSEYWKTLTQHVVHPGDPKLQGQLATIIEGYLGDLKEVKAKELMVRHGRYAQSNLDGYDTFVDEKGKEDTVVWKIEVPKNNAGIAERLRFEKERSEAAKYGYTVLSNGRVVDKNGRRVYRKGHFGYFKDILNPFAKKAFGSPYVRRNFGAESWKRRRELLYKQLNSGLMSPEAWEVENRRFQAELFLGVQLDWEKPVTLTEIFNKIKKKPSLLLWMPWTLIRGMYVNSPVELGDLFAFLEPLNKEVSKQIKI